MQVHGSRIPVKEMIANIEKCHDAGSAARGEGGLYWAGPESGGGQWGADGCVAAGGGGGGAVEGDSLGGDSGEDC